MALKQISANSPERPELVFRVGITGARCIPAAEEQRIAAQMHEVMSLLQKCLKDLAADERVKSFYRCDAGGEVVPVVRLISPLAKGTDRIAARTARELNIPFDVVMPFAQEEYERDFQGKEAKCPAERALTAEEDRQGFLELLHDRVGLVMLDGARDRKAIDPGWTLGADMFRGCPTSR